MFHWIATPWIEIASVRGMKSGIVWKLGPYTARPMFWRMNETPTAVINGASRGARRSGLYAMRSITAFATANPGIVTRSTSRSPPMITGTLVSVSRPSHVMIENATSPDSMKTSPCAKLMSCRIP